MPIFKIEIKNQTMNLLKVTLSISFLITSFFGNAQNQNFIKVSNNEEILNTISHLKPGDCLLLKSGEYKNMKLVVENSGVENAPILIKAESPGEVFFTGDVKVELKGNYIQLDGIYFKNGNRNPNEWRSHGPGLVAIYGSYNRITQCAFHAFDEADSAFITTSLTKEGKVPQHCRIDHCSFTDKTTFDQVLNLNNTFQTTKTGEPGIAMYHRIDHNYFSNPKKPGNAGAGIRVGYWRKDYGRCLIDNNVFDRQDSEAEIITSKSMENVYYNNTFLNCQGTLNFRHGDKQVALNNFFITNDTKYEYGGMFVWGSNHVIASNYFELDRTINSRGNAALYLNSGTVGDEHALAFNIILANNIFANNNGSDIDFQALSERRKEHCVQLGIPFETPRDISFLGNIFYYNGQSNLVFFNKISNQDRNITWENNWAYGKKLGIEKNKGINENSFTMTKELNGIFKTSSFKNSTITTYTIEGIDLNISDIASGGVQGKPKAFTEVGPDWLKTNPSMYAETGKLSPEMAIRLAKLSKRK